MGLLDQFTGDERGLLGLALMQAAQPRAGGPAGIGEGLLGALNMIQQRKAAQEDRDMRRQLMQSQIAETQAQAQQRQAQAQEQQRKALEAARIQSLLQSTFMPVTGTQANAVSGVTGPRPEALGAVGQQRPVNYQQLLAQGVPADVVKSLADARNYGRDEVTARETVAGPGGLPVIRQLTKYGDTVGQDIAKPVEMRLENLGGQSVAVNPFALRQGQSFQRTMSPDAQASNALGWANYGLAKQRAAQESAGQLVETPEGYVRVGHDNQATPVTMGGKPVMGKGASPKDMTDSQAKALLFGQRAKEADSILNKIAAAGTNRPSIVKQGVEGIPWVGGALGAAANTFIATPDQQSVEQAQRDFVNAVLRRESGAVISEPEFENAKRQYFPQVGDSPQLVAQKAKNRALATELILREVPAQHRVQDAPQAPRQRISFSSLPPAEAPGASPRVKFSDLRD